MAVPPAFGKPILRRKYHKNRQLLQAGEKGIFKMLEEGRGARNEQNRDNVEAESPFVAFGPHVFLGCVGKEPPFFGGDESGRMPKTCRAPGLHFEKNHHGTGHRDDIDLGPAEPPILFQD